MKYILLFIGMFSLVHVNGQTAPLQSTKIDSQYSRSNSTQMERDSYYLALPIVEDSPFHIHMRISLFGQTVDFFSPDGIDYQGVLTNYITEYREEKTEYGKQNKAFQVLFQKQLLDGTRSTEMALELLKIRRNSSGNVSTALFSGEDRTYYKNVHFQCKEGAHFQEKNIYPLDTVLEERALVACFHLIKSELGLVTSFGRFMALLPIGKNYSVTGYTMHHLFNEKEQKLWEKQRLRRNYLDSIRDSVVAFLKAELLKKEKVSDLECCSDRYLITFNRGGELTKIHLPKNDYSPKPSDGLGEYLYERKELRKCSKAIRQQFDRINLSSFHLQYPLRTYIEVDLED